ncbi:MAG: nucleoside recognition domain-containing protein [Candidatus Krumholzibacteria bacterium]|jgi:spore maturation protein SpmA|nr:nucleoside recognition domain-containing protein [Candidatus Krumholzibacteria bacterium]
MLNRIWTAFFFVAAAAALWQWLLLGNAGVWQDIVGSTFEMAKTAFEVALGLTGVMTLWLGIMRIGEQGGAVELLARAFRPLLRRLFPGVPAGHPAEGAMVMNMAANMLGLDNAATPLGLKAMRELQTLNPSDDTASNDQILFLVINTSAVTVVPVTIFTYRAQLGAADPTDIFLPILIATFCSTMTGLLVTSAVQKLRLWQPVVLAYLAGLTALVGGLVVAFARLPREVMEQQSALLANLLIFGLVIAFFALGVRRRLNLYEAFIDGAKDGFKTAVTIIPYLVAMLVAIGVLRASGALDLFLDGVRGAVAGLGLDTRWVDGLPTALMKPLSGSGARGMLIETMAAHGADSFAGRLASVVQGSTETTFYVLAVYFGAVRIKHARHALACGLSADLAGVVAAILVCYLFFA